MYSVLIFNGYYLPSKNYGGPLTSIINVVDSCHRDYEFYVVCKNHDFNSTVPFDVETDTWLQVGNAKVMYLSDNKIGFSKTEIGRLLDSVNPDMIWLTGILRPQIKLVATRLAKDRHIPVLISPRGELDRDRVRIKWYKKFPYLRLVRLVNVYGRSFFHATSEDERKGIKRFFSPENGHIFYAPNISIAKQPVITSHIKETGKLNVLFFSRIHPVKNLLFAFEVLSKCKSSFSFDVYGPLEDKEYWNRCMDIAKGFDSNIIVQYKGVLSKDDLSRVVQEHDCLLFPTLNENYGHVIAETLANSRPVVISKGTTPWDIVDGVAGYAIELNQPERFAECLDKLAEMDNLSFSALIDSTSSFFDSCPLVSDAIESHIDMFNKVIGSRI